MACLPQSWSATVTESFQVRSGVKQGCVIAPTLFAIFVATIIHIIKDDLPPGIEIVYRTDGRLFNLAHLKSKIKTSTNSLIEFQYADDNSVGALSENHLQQFLTAFNCAYTKLRLAINSRKTQIIYQPSPIETNRIEPSFQLGEKTLENVDYFLYLGSHLSSNVDLNDEIQHRLKCAGTAFGCLRTRVLHDHDIRTDTKMLVYKAVVIPTLLYASETWTTYRRHLKALEKFHQRCLQNILNISWEDRRTNVSVLNEPKTTSIEAYVIKNQLRWSGHVVWMKDECLPKQIFCSQLKEGKHKRDGQQKRFKDVLKANMKKCNIDINNWETNAKDRKLRQAINREGTATFKANRCAELEEKRRKWRGGSNNQSPICHLELPVLNAKELSKPRLDS
ncbi:uncharacterized protein LOC134356870 [Mobula hypostoma]|uniref:uncharacterized protein LOC134356870 n=1 Tax=Mobula hypostoma TaxID=723540 RepID=UPI002FC39080